MDPLSKYMRDLQATQAGFSDPIASAGAAFQTDVRRSNTPKEPLWRDPEALADEGTLRVNSANQVPNTALWGITSLLPTPSGGGARPNAAAITRKGSGRQMRKGAKDPGWRQQVEGAPADPVREKPVYLNPGGNPSGKGFQYAPDRQQLDALGAQAAQGDPKSLDMVLHDMQRSLERIARRFGKTEYAKSAKDVVEPSVSSKELKAEGQASLLRHLPNYDPARGGFMQNIFPQVQRDVARYSVAAKRPVSKAGYETAKGSTEDLVWQEVTKFEKRWGHKPNASFLEIKLKDKNIKREDIDAVLNPEQRGKRAVRGQSADQPVRVESKSGEIEEQLPLQLHRTEQVTDNPLDRLIEREEGTGQRDQMLRALEQLRPEHKSALEHKLAGTPSRAAAEAVGVPLRTYQRRLKEAEQALQDLIERVSGKKPIGGGSGLTNDETDFFRNWHESFKSGETNLPAPNRSMRLHDPKVKEIHGDIDRGRRDMISGKRIAGHDEIDISGDSRFPHESFAYYADKHADGTKNPPPYGSEHRDAWKARRDAAYKELRAHNDLTTLRNASREANPEAGNDNRYQRDKPDTRPISEAGLTNSIIGDAMQLFMGSQQSSKYGHNYGTREADLSPDQLRQLTPGRASDDRADRITWRDITNAPDPVITRNEPPPGSFAGGSDAKFSPLQTQKQNAAALEQLKKRLSGLELLIQQGKRESAGPDRPRPVRPISGGSDAPGDFVPGGPFRESGQEPSFRGMGPEWPYGASRKLRGGMGDAGGSFDPKADLSNTKLGYSNWEKRDPSQTHLTPGTNKQNRKTTRDVRERVFGTRLPNQVREGADFQATGEGGSDMTPLRGEMMARFRELYGDIPMSDDTELRHSTAERLRENYGPFTKRRPGNPPPIGGGSEGVPHETGFTQDQRNQLFWSNRQMEGQGRTHPDHLLDYDRFIGSSIPDVNRPDVASFYDTPIRGLQRGEPTTMGKMAFENPTNRSILVDLLKALAGYQNRQ